MPERIRNAPDGDRLGNCLSQGDRGAFGPASPGDDDPAHREKRHANHPTSRLNRTTRRYPSSCSASLSVASIMFHALITASRAASTRSSTSPVASRRSRWRSASISLARICAVWILSSMRNVHSRLNARARTPGRLAPPTPPAPAPQAPADLPTTRGAPQAVPPAGRRGVPTLPGRPASCAVPRRCWR